MEFKNSVKELRLKLLVKELRLKLLVKELRLKLLVKELRLKLLVKELRLKLLVKELRLKLLVKKLFSHLEKCFLPFLNSCSFKHGLCRVEELLKELASLLSLLILERLGEEGFYSGLIQY